MEKICSQFFQFKSKCVRERFQKTTQPPEAAVDEMDSRKPQNKEKHFLVTKVINPETQKHLIEEVVMEAVLTRRSFRLRWAELLDERKWRRGWV